jgi:hypothetical protein
VEALSEAEQEIIENAWIESPKDGPSGDDDPMYRAVERILAARAAVPDALRVRVEEAVAAVADNERDLTSSAPTAALIDRLAALRALLEDGAQ